MGTDVQMERRLLVVDDDIRLTGIVALTAAQLGIVTRQCNDSKSALDAFLQFRPDVVMIDIYMPEQDGIDVLHEILLTGIATGVILTTGGGEDLLSVAQDVVRFHGAAEASVLHKPFRRVELVEALTSLMD